MKATVFLFVLLSYLILVFADDQIIHQWVSLGQPVNLTAGEKCPDARWVHRLDGKSTRPVGDFDSGVFKPAAGYENRVTPAADGSCSLVLSHTTFNDQGYYEFSCGDRFMKIVWVDILVPFEQSVLEGQNATLRCHSVTTAEAAHPGALFKWEREGELVCKVDPPWNLTYGTGFEGRVSVSPDGYREGDLALTLMDVKQADQGLYRCYHGEDKGKPDAVELTVNRATEKPKGPVNSLTVTELVVVVVVVAIVMFLLGVLAGWCLKSRGFYAPNRPENAAPHELDCLSSPVSNGSLSPSNGHSGQMSHRVNSPLTDEHAL